MTGHDERLPSEAGRVRATDVDRDEVVTRLKRALDVGALHFDEIESRLAAVYAARTKAELHGLTADLPVEVDPTPVERRARPSAMETSSFRVHAIVYALVIAMLVGIWAMSGGGRPFWPFFPAAGWGVGLGAHYAVASEVARKKARRRQRAERRALERSESARELPPAGPSRTFVAAMFADVVGSTSLNEAMGDEQWARERARFRSLVQSCAAVEGGWEVNAAGDGVLVRFTSPASAVRAAVALQKAMQDRRATTFAPNVSIGIHSGDVIDEGDDIIGSVINMAARVGDVAEADEIVVTEHVADHVDDVVTADRGLHELRGIGRPRHLLTVVWR